MPEHDRHSEQDEAAHHAGLHQEEDAGGDEVTTGDPEGRAAQLLLSGHTQAQTADALAQQGLARTDARHITESVHRDIAAQLDAQRPDAASLPRGVVAGIVSALVSGIAWGLIVWKTGYEIGFAAWGVGLLTGFAVLTATGHRKGRSLQVVAVLASLLGILLGKYLTIFFFAREEVDGLSAFDPAIFDYMRDNPSEVFSLFDLLFVGFAVVSAWRMLEPTRANFLRDEHAG